LHRMNDVKEKILEVLPYGPPFRFVDELLRVDENSIEGVYTFREDEHFYAGHFKDRPVTPGVILTECMAQIGVACLGIYLSINDDSNSENGQPAFAFTESKVMFENPVFPGEKVHVISRKKYWRLGKLNCLVELYNDKQERVCVGELSGMVKMIE